MCAFWDLRLSAVGAPAAVDAVVQAVWMHVQHILPHCLWPQAYRVHTTAIVHDCHTIMRTPRGCKNQMHSLLGPKQFQLSLQSATQTLLRRASPILLTACAVGSIPHIVLLSPLPICLHALWPTACIDTHANMLCDPPSVCLQSAGLLGRVQVVLLWLLLALGAT